MLRLRGDSLPVLPDFAQHDKEMNKLNPMSGMVSAVEASLRPRVPVCKFFRIDPAATRGYSSCPMSVLGS